RPVPPPTLTSVSLRLPPPPPHSPYTTLFRSPAAEDQLTSRGIPVIPDFIANTGAAAWAWWLLFGQVSTDPRDSLQRLRTEMNTKVQHLVRTWNEQGLRPRQAAYEIAAENLSGMAHDPEVPIP